MRKSGLQHALWQNHDVQNPVQNSDQQNQSSAVGLPDRRDSSVATDTPVARRHLWPHRLFTMLFVVFCILLGMRLMVLPWSQGWTSNRWLDYYPVMRDFLGLDLVRGAVSGLGLVDVWLGFNTAINYREN